MYWYGRLFSAWSSSFLRSALMGVALAEAAVNNKIPERVSNEIGSRIRGPCTDTKDWMQMARAGVGECRCGELLTGDETRHAASLRADLNAEGNFRQLRRLHRRGACATPNATGKD